MTSALENGELSKIATAYTEELKALQKENTGTTSVHRNNTAGKRAKEATSDHEKAKAGEGNLADTTNELSNALDKLPVEAADRATWAQRRTSHRKAAWPPQMAEHSAALSFLKQSVRWQLPHLRGKRSQLTPAQ